METVTCPKCNEVNPANATNCQNCKINLAFALANPGEFEKPPANKQESLTTANHPQNKHIQRWEYCELEVTIGGPLTGVQGQLAIFKADGQFLERKGKYGILLAQLGQEGWEVVTASARIEAGLGSKHKINYILKRPLQ